MFPANSFSRPGRGAAGGKKATNSSHFPASNSTSALNLNPRTNLNLPEFFHRLQVPLAWRGCLRNSREKISRHEMRGGKKAQNSTVRRVTQVQNGRVEPHETWFRLFGPNFVEL